MSAAVDSIPITVIVVMISLNVLSFIIIASTHIWFIAKVNDIAKNVIPAIRSPRSVAETIIKTFFVLLSGEFFGVLQNLTRAMMKKVIIIAGIPNKMVSQIII